ncbi:hypothetical protein GCM10027425_27940 [Alteromonas gracilis]
MSRHVDDELLAALALGEEADLTDIERQHAASCATCAAEVETLRSVAGDLREVRDVEILTPAPEVWDRVLAEAQAPVGGGASRRPWAMVLAAAAVVVALLGGLAVGRATAPPSAPEDLPIAQSVATAALAPYDDHRTEGEAEVVRRDGETLLVVDARDRDADPGRREVWLLNADGERLVSLGILGASGRGEFVIAPELLDDGYRTVDISAEDDGDPTHSGNSLARGELADL